MSLYSSSSTEDEGKESSSDDMETSHNDTRKNTFS